MREELLHFIWRFRHFNQQGLSTEAGEPLEVLSPGELQTDQGPDFRDARIRIGDVLHAGPVELHIRASDWIRHGHEGDIHYRKVILHVVWENDSRELPGNIPMLVLCHRVSGLLLGRYERLMKGVFFVPCAALLPLNNAMLWEEWIGRLVRQRLERRAREIRLWLGQNRENWEETGWWLMARSMGQPVNAELFEGVARSLPLRLLHRHRLYRSTLESLLLGQAGLLDAGSGAEREYAFWQAKYGLRPVSIPVSFLRMRPGHSPAKRLVQLAAVVASGRGWFSLIREESSAAGIMEALAGPAGLGAEMRRGVIVNAFIPLLYAYGQQEKALQWLRALKAEPNRETRGWARLGVVVGDAMGSQALLELKKEYCNARRCLECAVGRALLAA